MAFVAGLFDVDEVAFEAVVAAHVADVHEEVASASSAVRRYEAAGFTPRVAVCTGAIEVRELFVHASRSTAAVDCVVRESQLTGKTC